MKRFSVLVLMASSLLAQSDVEQAVLRGVQKKMQETGGRVAFSDLYNDSSFSPEQRAFLGRLYEIFFQIPDYLQATFRSSGAIPSRTQMATHFGISPTSVELLLRVMKSDSRVPPLFSREPGGEITELRLDVIDAFVKGRGQQVQMTQWVGKPIPGFNLNRIGGGEFSSQDLKGHPGLAYFWFTGCPPCVRIAPLLAQLETEYRSKGFRVIGLNADQILGIADPEGERLEYLKKNGVQYPNLHLTEQVRAAFGNVNVYPTLFFFDSAGKIAEHRVNYQDRETLEAIFRRLTSP